MSPTEQVNSSMKPDDGQTPPSKRAAVTRHTARAVRPSGRPHVSGGECFHPPSNEPSLARQDGNTSSSPPELSSACYCSDFNSAGIPCPPGKCPNRPEQVAYRTAYRSAFQGAIASRNSAEALLGALAWLVHLEPRSPAEERAVALYVALRAGGAGGEECARALVALFIRETEPLP